MMAKRKNRFLNFWISLVPGAGQMYQGYIKRGISILTIFCGWIALCAFLGIDELLFFIPVIWFFGFFDALHTNSLTDEERMQQRDAFLFIEGLERVQIGKFRIPVASVLIFIGVYLLARMLVDTLITIGIFSWDSPFYWAVREGFPRTVLSLASILAGVYLIIGKKIEIDQRGQFDQEKNRDWEDAWQVPFQSQQTAWGDKKADNAQNRNTESWKDAGQETQPKNGQDVTWEVQKDNMRGISREMQTGNVQSIRQEIQPDNVQGVSREIQTGNAQSISREIQIENGQNVSRKIQKDNMQSVRWEMQTEDGQSVRWEARTEDRQSMEQKSKHDSGKNIGYEDVAYIPETGKNGGEGI